MTSAVRLAKSGLANALTILGDLLIMPAYARTAGKPDAPRLAFNFSTKACRNSFRFRIGH